MRGFVSLIGLLLTVAIIVVFAVYVRPDFLARIPGINDGINTQDVLRDPTGIRNAAYDATRKADLKQLQSYLEAYYVGEGEGRYPSSLDELLVGGYTGRDRLSVDPSTKAPYEYRVGEGGVSYALCTDLSNRERFCVSNSVNGR